MMSTPAQTQTFPEIREGIRRLCAEYPGAYWRKLDSERRYPSEFVTALAREGWLSVLIPEEYGGSGLGLSAAIAVLEEVHRAGCNGGAAHAQMYTMGTVLRHGSQTQKALYLPKIASGELRLQAFAVTEPTSGTDTTRIRTFAERRGAPCERRIIGVDDSALDKRWRFRMQPCRCGKPFSNVHEYSPVILMHA